MHLTSSLLRVSLLLFVVSFVGVIGLNGSLDPSRIQTAKAAALDIVLSSDSQSTLQFQLTPSQDCPPALAPGDSCFAQVLVQNAGTETAEISPPTAFVSGALNTCDGGGPNITVFFQNATYSDPVHLVPPGGTESFDVRFTLSAAIGNPCQGQTATITVSIQTGLPLATATPTPTTTLQLQAPEPAEEQPTQQVGGVIVTPTTAPAATVAPGLSVDTNFGNDLISEIGGTQVTRLPVTGQGWHEPHRLNASALFWALGIASIGVFIAALLLRRKEARR